MRPLRKRPRGSEVSLVQQGKDKNPSGLEYPELIDTIALSPEKDLVQLVIHADRQWDGSRRSVELLTQKIGNYLDYIRTGELYKQHPEVRRTTWQIVWSMDGKLDRRSEELVEKFEIETRKMGGDFKIHSHGERWSWSFRRG